MQHSRAELVETRVCFAILRLSPFENLGECRIPCELFGSERIKIRQLDHSRFLPLQEKLMKCVPLRLKKFDNQLINY